MRSVVGLLPISPDRAAYVPSGVIRPGRSRRCTFRKRSINSQIPHGRQIETHHFARPLVAVDQIRHTW